MCFVVLGQGMCVATSRRKTPGLSSAAPRWFATLVLFALPNFVHSDVYRKRTRILMWTLAVVIAI